MAIELRREQKEFRDISLTFTPNPITGDLTILRDERAINNAVKNCILISINEVPFQRDFGSTIPELLFEMCDEITAGQVEDEVRRSINFNEPRVEIQRLIVEPRPDENAFFCYIKYNIVGYDEVFIIQEILRPTR